MLQRIISRSRAREVALQVLFAEDLNPGRDPADGDDFVRNRIQFPEVIEFARYLVAGVRHNREELDAILTRTADNWSLTRMAVTDRNILRLGAFEMLYTEMPELIALNEAVVLAKRYGSKQSGHFVNGVLDKLLAGHEKK
jgi:transcription antitermination protein NusB